MYIMHYLESNTVPTVKTHKGQWNRINIHTFSSPATPTQSNKQNQHKLPSAFTLAEFNGFPYPFRSMSLLTKVNT